jgi:hypothetical protein
MILQLFGNKSLVVQAVDFFECIRGRLSKPPTLTALADWLVAMREMGANPKTGLKDQSVIALRTLSLLAKTSRDQSTAYRAFNDWLELR